MGILREATLRFGHPGTHSYRQLGTTMTPATKGNSRVPTWYDRQSIELIFVWISVGLNFTSHFVRGKEAGRGPQVCFCPSTRRDLLAHSDVLWPYCGLTSRPLVVRFLWHPSNRSPQKDIFTPIFRCPSPQIFLPRLSALLAADIPGSIFHSSDFHVSLPRTNIVALP